MYLILIEINQLYDNIYIPLKPNTVIFNCVKNILLYCGDNKNVLLSDFFENFYNLFPLKKEFIKDIYICKRYKISKRYLEGILNENIIKEYVTNTPKYYTYNLTFSLLSLLYYHKNYYLFKQLSSIANGELNYFIGWNISNLFEIIIKCEILNNNQDIDINISDTKYKYYIITFTMISIKQHFNDIVSYNKKEWVNVKMDKKEELVNFSDEFKKDSKIKEYFSNNQPIYSFNAGFVANEIKINNFITNIKNSFEEIFTNTEFCEVMDIDINKKEEYRKFIDEKLNALEEIVKSNE